MVCPASYPHNVVAIHVFMAFIRGLARLTEIQRTTFPLSFREEPLTKLHNGGGKIALLRHPALADLPQTPSHLADALSLSLAHGRPFAAPAPHLRPLGGIEGVHLPLPTAALPRAADVPAGGVAAWSSTQAFCKTVAVTGS